MTQTTRASLSAERVRELLDYDPSTGIFTNRARRQRVKVGAPAGYTRKDGYVAIGLDGQKYFAHRLAWLYMTGSWPKNEVDHRDLNTSNNAWANLRDATHAENHCNVRMYRNNKTGFKGVRKVSKDRFRAQITIDRNVIHLGSFRDAHKAHAAYVSAAFAVRPEYARAA